MDMWNLSTRRTEKQPGERPELDEKAIGQLTFNTRVFSAANRVYLFMYVDAIPSKSRMKDVLYLVKRHNAYKGHEVVEAAITLANGYNYTYRARSEEDVLSSVTNWVNCNAERETKDVALDLKLICRDPTDKEYVKVAEKALSVIEYLEQENAKLAGTSVGFAEELRERDTLLAVRVAERISQLEQQLALAKSRQDDMLKPKRYQ